MLCRRALLRRTIVLHLYSAFVVVRWCFEFSSCISCGRMPCRRVRRTIALHLYIAFAVVKASQAIRPSQIQSQIQMAQPQGEPDDREECESCLWHGVVGMEPFVIMNLEWTTHYDGDCAVKSQSERFVCRDCAGDIFSDPSRFKILDIRLCRRIQQASAGRH